MRRRTSRSRLFLASFASTNFPSTRAFRALRGLLSCVDKQCFTTAAGWSSNQRNHPSQPVVRALRGRSASTRAFPEGTSMHRPETARIVRAALRVFAPPACRASTGLRSERQEHLPRTTSHMGAFICCAVPSRRRTRRRSGTSAGCTQRRAPRSSGSAVR